MPYPPLRSGGAGRPVPWHGARAASARSPCASRRGRRGKPRRRIYSPPLRLGSLCPMDGQRAIAPLPPARRRKPNAAPSPNFLTSYLLILPCSPFWGVTGEVARRSRRFGAKSVTEGANPVDEQSHRHPQQSPLQLCNHKRAAHPYQSRTAAEPTPHHSAPAPAPYEHRRPQALQPCHSPAPMTSSPPPE